MISSRAGRLPVVVLIAGLCWGCGRGDDFSAIRNLDSSGQAIICFGDSLTEGVGVGSGEDFPSQLSIQLGREVINAGHRGDTSARALARLEADVLARNPRVVVVLLGGNDFLRRVSLNETRKNLTEIVRRIHEAGAMVVIAGIRLGLLTDDYGPVYGEIADREGALYVARVMKGILTDSRLKSDAIHPNGAGYRLMAERVAEKVRPLLEEADRRIGASAAG